MAGQSETDDARRRVIGRNRHKTPASGGIFAPYEWSVNLPTLDAAAVGSHDSNVGEEIVDPLFERSLIAACASFGVRVAPAQIERMWRHFRLVRETNTKFNLTRITDVRRAAVEHYADSLTLLPWLADRAVEPARALDVGTGGGWPAVPLAIMLPQVQWTAIDSTGKKARFVAEAVAALGLANLTVLQVRANELASRTAPFDLVVCRAVGKLPDLVAETSRLIAHSGYLVCYKTAELSPEERQAGERAAARAQLTPQPDRPISLRTGGETFRRLLVSYRKRQDPGGTDGARGADGLTQTAGSAVRRHEDCAPRQPAAD